MREIYESDDDLFWIVYPLEEGSSNPIEPVGTEETITLMRYGSGGDTIHYYFCPHYFCLNDEIMVRGVDFEAITDRDGNPKPANTCPFCYGKLITNRKKAMIGHTVIKRKDKKDTDTYHAYMEFMSKTTHPENFALPCCFVKHKTLRMDNPQFSHLRDFLQISKLQENENQNDIDDEQSYDQLILRSGDPIEYSVLFETMYKKYILEYNKQPVPGHFAIAPPIFDTYFRQNSSESIITRVAIHLRLRPNAVGFLRIGTEHSINESLLGVIAPLLYRNYIHEVKERIIEVMVPRVFINAHFGNLVLEFYNPADQNSMPETKQQLMQWCHEHLGISVNSTNMYALLRIFNAYHRFIDFINDPTKRKDLRHIQPLLSEPGLFTARGLQLIVLEENDTEDSISVRCPTFGVSSDRHKNNDFAFISRNIKKSVPPHAYYELYIHTSNMPAKGGISEIHETIVRWEYTSRKIWPEIVRTRIDEYMNQCQSRYRSLYSLQEGIHSMAMIPLSKAVESSPKRPEGIIKDSYNHIIGVTFRSKPGSTFLVALPVVDDGVISISSAFSIKNIYLDWDDIKPAPAEDIIRYYRQDLESLFSLYPGYRVKYIVRRSSEKKIVAIQLENGIYIPAGEPKNDSAIEASGIPIVEIEQFEWTINKQLAGIKTNAKYNDWSKVDLNSIIENTMIEKSCGSDIELLRTSSYKEFEELYQQFRLMVSNWLTSHQAGSEIRKGIEDIIFNKNLPEYERRKRLYIFISTELLSWFYPDKDDWESAETSFLRKDCRMTKSPESCTGNCYWRQDNESKEESEGKCLLHVKETVEFGDKDNGRIVSTPELFTKRIIDELVRFPNRRKQLMKKGEISKLSTIIKPIHQGDQYIIPESSGTWVNLLRLDWATQKLEESQYYEEMSRDADDADKNSQYDTLPAELIAIFGENSKFRMMIPKTIKNSASHHFLPFTGILGVTMEQIGMKENESMQLDNMIQYVRVTSKPIGVIHIGEEKPIQFAKPRTGIFDTVTILIYLSNGDIGILLEDGSSSIPISQLPLFIQEQWNEAHITQIVMMR